MNCKEKVKPFERYLGMMKNSSIIDAVTTMLCEFVPEYFWQIAASSGGKYHPEFAQGISGLIRHTQAALIVAYELFSNPIVTKFSKDEQDVIFASLILHDTFKNGLPESRSKWTNVFHPQIAATEFYEGVPREMLGEPYRSAIYGAIQKHMGPWGGSKTKRLPLPETELERFVHLADFIASRKIIPDYWHVLKG